MSCPPVSSPPLLIPFVVFQQIKEVLLELSMAFDNFIEVNNSFEYDSKVPVGTRTAYKFQRRKPTDSDSTSSSSNSNSSGRKRSWESDEQHNSEFSLPTFDSSNFPGKRSKSLVLTQELEGLRLSSSSSLTELDLEMNDWLDQDLNVNNKSSILDNIERFDDLKREIELIGRNGSIDDLLKVLCSYKSNNTDTLTRNNLVTMTHWIKWGIINEVSESIKSPDLQVKTILTRSLLLLKALNRIGSLIDWNDPELPFLLNKFLIILLNSEKFKNATVSSTHHRLTLVLNKKLEEYLGLLRVLNLFSRLLIPQTSFNFLLSRPETSNQLIELLELLFETNLNIFELTATISTINKDYSNFNSAAISVLLTLKIVESYGNYCKEINEIKQIILNIKNRLKQL